MPTKFDFISPGIQINEIDESILPADVVQPGPIIIGRTPKGPAMKPVRVNTLADYINVFGAPIPGGSSRTGDVWRDGPGSTAPTYASYAAQSWLASQTTGITVVRLAGEEVSSGPTGRRAGWTLSGSGANQADASNSVAYGLFIVPSGSLDETGCLAAVIYANEGSLALSGSTPAGSVVEQAVTLVANTGPDYEFKFQVYDNAGSKIGDDISINFNRNSDNYIRKALNTNPILTNNDTVAIVHSDYTKTYWVGETFTKFLTDTVSNGSTGKCYGMLAPLQQEGGTTETQWANRQMGMKVAKSGMVISDKGTEQQDLFRIALLHEGEQPQKDIMIAIEEIKAPVNPLSSNFGTFTIRVTNLQGQTIESFKNLTFDENSVDFVSRRIGDQNLEWDEEKRRYNVTGEHPNVSSYIRIELQSEIPEGALPFGFKGPGRPKGFTVRHNSIGIKNIGTDVNNTSLFCLGSGSVPKSHNNSINAIDGVVANMSASFLFPKLSLRTAGTEGYPASQFKAYYGILPKISANSSVSDPDYIDYLRGLPSGDYDNVFSPTGEYEHSFIFTLDDIKVSGNDVTYSSGSYSETKGTAAASLTKNSGSSELLKKGIKQFYMPVFGGFDGLDIRTKEPFSNEYLQSTDSDTNNALHYSIFKAIDSVSDSEVSLGNIMTIPGLYKSHITDKIIATCEARQDALAIIDLDKDYKSKYEQAATATDKARRGDVDEAVTTLKNRNLNSSYACAFYPWIQVSDTLNNNQRVWIPSSIAGLGAMARTEATSELWFAPAGFNRGGLGNLGGPAGPLVIQARQRLDVNQRDDLYAQGINPIASFPNEGVVIFGQKTLQKANSALDRINVRRLMIFLKHEVGEVAKTTLFQPNVQATWNSFKSRVEPILTDVQSRFGITDYRLILDESTTTPDLIDRNILYAKIFLKPARAIEFIAIDFVITKSGAELV